VVRIEKVPKFGPCQAWSGHDRTRAFLNGLWSDMNKSQVMSCLFDGLVARLRHDTSLVN
jgi:hypothetical protein